MLLYIFFNILLSLSVVIITGKIIVKLLHLTNSFYFPLDITSYQKAWDRVHGDLYHK